MRLSPLARAAIAAVQERCRLGALLYLDLDRSADRIIAALQAPSR